MSPSEAPVVQSLDAQHARLRHLLTLLDRDQTNAALRAECMSLALDSSDFDCAELLARRALQAQPDDAGARFTLATVKMAQRDFAAAQAALRDLLDEGVDNPGVRLNLATCECLNGRYEQVAQLLEPLYAAGHRDANLMRLLISAHHHLGHIEQAVILADDNEPAAREDGPTAGVFALLYLDASRAGPAARCAKWALAAHPDSVDGLIVQATLDAAELRAPRAITQYRRVTELAPENGRAWIGLGTMALLAQDFPAAKAHFEQGLRYLPGHLGTWITLGWTHLLSGDLAEAETTFRNTLERDRNYGETYGALAAVAALQGRQNEAQRSIEVALRLDPASLSTKFAQAVLTGAAGNPEAARELIMNTAAALGASAGPRAAGYFRELTPRH